MELTLREQVEELTEAIAQIQLRLGEGRAPSNASNAESNEAARVYIATLEQQLEFFKLNKGMDVYQLLVALFDARHTILSQQSQLIRLSAGARKLGIVVQLMDNPVLKDHLVMGTKVQLTDTGDYVTLVDTIPDTALSFVVELETGDRADIALYGKSELIGVDQPLIYPWEYQPGTRVRVRRSGRYSGHRGTITQNANEEGYVEVKIDDFPNPLRFSIGRLEASIRPLGMPSRLAMISLGNETIQVGLTLDQEIAVGDFVALNSQTFEILDVVHAHFPGEIARVTQHLTTSENMCVVDQGGTPTVVFLTKGLTKPDVGQNVILDKTGQVILEVLARPESQLIVRESPGVDWGDIGGYEEEIRQIREAVELPLSNVDLMNQFGLKPISGMCIFGPSGCGKTYMGKATATSIGRYHGFENGSFLYVRGPELLSRWVGVAEAGIISLFDMANRHWERFGFRSVIFFDEAEGLFRKRGSGVSTDVTDSLVDIILAQMAGFEECRALIIFATNRPEMLDPALINGHRVQLRLRIGRPDPGAAKRIFAIHLDKVKVSTRCPIEDLATYGVDEIFSSKRLMFGLDLGQYGYENFGMDNLICGAMIAEVVQKAASIALRRALTNSPDNVGVNRQDIVQAVDAVHSDLIYFDHRLAIAEFLGERLGYLKNIEMKFKKEGR